MSGCGMVMALPTVVQVRTLRSPSVGVTVHFQGQLRHAALTDVLAIAAEHAELNGWWSESLDRDHDILERVIDEEPCDYEGPVLGIVLFPHEDCEPVRLEFDASLFIQDYTKTQFAILVREEHDAEY